MFKIPQHNPWAWQEVEYVYNEIEIQGHFGHEAINNTLWYTKGYPTKTKAELPRLVMVPYAMVEWLVQSNKTPYELMLWIENQDKDGPNFQKYYWGLFNIP